MRAENTNPEERSVCSLDVIEHAWNIFEERRTTYCSCIGGSIDCLGHGDSKVKKNSKAALSTQPIHQKQVCLTARRIHTLYLYFIPFTQIF